MASRPAPGWIFFKRLRQLETATCPFANLPEPKSGRWGQGLTAAKMAECRWVKPALVGQFEFVEWTPDNHLRHSRFVALREDKKPRDVTRERRTKDSSKRGPLSFRRQGARVTTTLEVIELEPRIRRMTAQVRCSVDTRCCLLGTLQVVVPAPRAG